MQSELDKIYEEEFEEKLKGIAKKMKSECLSEASIRIAKNLKSMGLPTEQIAKATGLSSGEIQAI
ncbi:MAG: hypothetical protein IJ836_02115 [Spirochaetales bacterium]|nr:hypothetical protein [Spirochaetales bacterium]